MAAHAVDTVTSACSDHSVRVALDPGHDWNRPGATSARGAPEIQFNLDLASQVGAALDNAGIATLLTGDGGPVPLAERSRRAADGGANVFLSLHHDSVQPRYLSQWTVDGIPRMYSDRFRGYSIFVSGRNPRFDDSVSLARALGTAMRARGLAPTLHHAEPIPGEDRPLLDAELGIYRFDDLIVLRTAEMPAVLFEAGVIVHRDEELELASTSRRAITASAIVEALGVWCRRDSARKSVQ